MAAVSAFSHARGAYNSHKNQNGDGSPWDFSAPADPEHDPSSPQHFRPSEQSSQQKLNFNPQPQPRTPDRNEQMGSNGVVHGQSKPAGTIDPSYLSPYKQGIRPDLNASRSGSEADSLIDLYGRPRSLGERSVGNSLDKGERLTQQEETFLEDDDPERSRWIHRDKLAMIESHEMQEAGIKLPPQQVRSVGKSKTRRGHNESQEVPEMPVQEFDASAAKERKKRRTRSPDRQEDEGDETMINDFDLRTPEEIAADSYMDSNASKVYRQQDLRKSSSRIPLPRSSPMPIPQEHIERETPLPRKRGASGNWTGEENGISYNRVRSRGNSVGSQVLLDDPDLSYHTPTPASRPPSSDSPPKTRGLSNKTITHSRKPSLSNSTPPTTQPFRPRNPSTTTSPRTPSSTQRPKSRSGLEPRPATAINRPEGEAPWLATMYKPDPRLPPDQQLLPTHAKRLQQEQWERAQNQQQQQQQPQRKDSPQRRLSAKASPQLPREFSPLAEHTINGLQPSSRDADEKVLQERGSEWPLTVATPNQQLSSNGGPPVDGGKNAGYSTIPRVKRGDESPVRNGNGNQNQRVLDPFDRERIARADQEKSGSGSGRGQGEDGGGKEKGCGCCIVM